MDESLPRATLSERAQNGSCLHEIGSSPDHVDEGNPRPPSDRLGGLLLRVHRVENGTNAAYGRGTERLRPEGIAWPGPSARARRGTTNQPSFGTAMTTRAARAMALLLALLLLAAIAVTFWIRAREIVSLRIPLSELLLGGF